MKNKIFNEEYKKLNSAQMEAVETIEGPVMVVAGPGTGKTQILALRIGNILEKTDTKADSVLCLTFTNAGVEEMKKRLVNYLGEAGLEVYVSTFHKFGMKIVEEYYEVLGFKSSPKLLEDADIAIFFDEILQGHAWQYLRPRGDNSRYYSDLKSLISLLKRERVSREYFLEEVEKEINFLEKDPESISTRGESKGELKKEIVSKLESLERTKEVTKFIDIYEKAKTEKGVFDYDDVLINLVKIVESSPDALADIQEQYLYVLVDEHQDSSKVQNDFIKAVWGEVESPNVFVVGDDRQLIYGFSGASIDHFKSFKKTFPDAKIIPLVDNYRSTQIILDASHALLQSVMSDKKLVSQSKENHPIHLVEADSAYSEIVSAGLDIKEKVKDAIDINQCAILVNTNSQVRSALEILHSLDIRVSTVDALNLFDQEETHSFLRILKIISNPTNSSSLALSFFDKVSGISPLEAHTYIVKHNMREFSLDAALEEMAPSLFDENDAVSTWIKKLAKWREGVRSQDLLGIIREVGSELSNNKDKAKLVSEKEIINTIFDLAEKEVAKNPHTTLAQFTSFIDRLESYNEDISLLLDPKEGVRVLTLHSSKGREFDYVWIAHMNERSLNSSKRMGFSLPYSISARIEENDIDKIKRKLFVAITRARKFCTLSYAKFSKSGSDQELAKVITELPEEVFEKKKADTHHKKIELPKNNLNELKKLVSQKYTDRYVSVSLLNNFFECTWKWYFSNVLQMPMPVIENFEFGIAVHSSIDRILKLKDVPSEDLVLSIVKEEVAKSRYGNEDIRARMENEIQPIIKRWVKNRLPEIRLGRKMEEPIGVSDNRFPHLKIFGKIDLIENLGPKEVRVTDFKTGSVRKKSDIEKLDEEGRMSGNLRQLAMYSYLLRENPKWNTDARESRLEFLESKDSKKSFYDRVISNTEIELLIKDIADYDELVKEGGWVDRRCNYNSYGKNTECEYCKLAEVFKGL